MVAHLTAVLFPAIIIYSAVPGSSLFSWHPTLMSIGFALMMFEGIAVFSKSASLVPTISRASKVNIHTYAILAGMLLVFGGFAAIYINKERLGKDHFTSWHGILGVITITYACLQSLLGAMAKYFKYVGKYLKVKLVDLKLYHATSGLLTYTMVTGSLILGLWSSWADKQLGGILWWICFGCVSSSALVVMAHITTTYAPKTKVPLQASDIRNIQKKSQT